MRVTLLVVLLFGASSGSRVFQGDCASPRVLCEQVCVAVSQQTYECGCWDGHFLLDDGLSCRAYSAAQYEESREESRSHNMRSKASLTSVTTTSQSSEPPATTTTSAKSIAVASASDKLRKSLVPSLAFSGSNYAEFDIPDDAYLETNITLQFKLDEKRDGILLFAGQLVGPDFIAIAIDGPNIVLRHDCGEGTIEDMYHGEFALGEWHEVRVWRRNCDSTQLRVDDGRRLVDVASQFTNYKGITMDDGVYIGGAPRGIEDLRDKAGTDKGIRGCIRKLVINGQTLMDVEYGVNTAHHADILDTCKRTTKIEESAPSRTHIGYDLTRAGLPILTEADPARDASYSINIFVAGACES